MTGSFKFIEYVTVVATETTLKHSFCEMNALTCFSPPPKLIYINLAVASPWMSS